MRRLGLGGLLFLAAWVYALAEHWPPLWFRDLLLIAPIGIMISAIVRPKPWSGHPVVRAAYGFIVGSGLAGVPAGLEALFFAHFRDVWTPLAFTAVYAIPASACGRVIYLKVRRESPTLIKLHAPSPPWVRWAMAIGVIGGLAGYAFAVLVAVDQRPDLAIPQVVRSQVLDKEHFVDLSGIGHSVKLASWGWTSSDPDVEVGPGVLAQLSSGSKACITLHPGYLGWAWFEVAACGSD